MTILTSPSADTRLGDPTPALRNAERVAALRATGVLDTEGEESFDVLTRLAARMLGVSAAFVTLLDEDRQFTKSGVDGGVTARETSVQPLSHSFCQHVVAGAEPLAVRDARDHDVLCRNGAVESLGIVGYLGVPLVTADGHALGSLCVIERETRDWSADDVSMLTEVAGVVMREIVLRTDRRTLGREREFLAAVLESMSDAVVACDDDGNLTVFNHAARTFHGLEASAVPQEELARHFSLFHADGVTPLAASEIPLLRSLAGDEVNQAPMVIAPAGLPARSLLASGRRVLSREGQVIGAVVAMRDVTSERAVTAERDRLIAILERNPDSVGLCRLDGTVEYLNPAGRRMLGLGVDDPVSSVDARTLHPPAQLLMLMEEAVPAAARDGAWSGESVLRTADGREVPVWQTVIPHRSESTGRIEFLSTIIHDISAAKAAERALRESEARASVLAETVPALIWTVDRTGRVLSTNGHARDVMGMAVEDGRNTRERLEVIHPEDRSRHVAAWRAAFATGGELRLEHRVRDAQGEFRWHLSRAIPQDHDGDGVADVWFGASLDIHEARVATQELERERAFLATVLDSISDSIAVCDPALRLTLFNRATRELHGGEDGSLRPDDWTAQYAVFEEDGVTPMPGEHMPLVRALREPGVEHRIPFVFKREGEEPQHLVASARAIHAPDGTLLGAVSASRNVTLERRQAQALAESDERFRAARTISDALPQIVWTAGADGGFDFYNERWYEFTGLSHDETMDAGWEPVVHPDDLDDCVTRWRESVRTGAPFEAEYRFRRHDDGAFRWQLGRAIPVRDGAGAVTRWIGTFTDIDDQKAAAEVLLRTRDELEALVADRTHDLVIAREVAERANRAKSDFLSRASHELRTPLNAVIGFANIMLKNRRGTLAPEDLDFAGRIRRNGQHLLGLVNDILDLSRIESGKVQLELAPVALFDLLHDVEDALAGRAEEFGLRLELQLPPSDALGGREFTIVTDQQRLRQILLNLAGNAVKYTPAGSVVLRLVVDAKRRPVAIEVADTGPGIAPERLPTVFDAFTTGDAAAQGEASVGLGLAITRSLCGSLGYDLEVESELGAGSMFRVMLGR